ncbi:hypothetical protein ACVWZ4_005921 [Bradyrhizobium sp. USDA 4472]
MTVFSDCRAAEAVSEADETDVDIVADPVGLECNASGCIECNGPIPPKMWSYCGAGFGRLGRSHFDGNKSGTKARSVLYVGITEGVVGRSALVSV